MKSLDAKGGSWVFLFRCTAGNEVSFPVSLKWLRFEEVRSQRPQPVDDGWSWVVAEKHNPKCCFARSRSPASTV